MRNYKRKIITPIALAVMSMCLANSVSAEQPTEVSVCNAKTIEERVDDILNSFLYSYEKDSEGFSTIGGDYDAVMNAVQSGEIYNFRYDGNSYINRANALASIIKVMGVSDDFINHLLLVEDNNYDVYYSYNSGSVFTAQYILSALRTFDDVEDYEVSDSNGFKGSLTSLDNAQFYPHRNCTIEEALKFIARAINSENSEDYIGIARKNNLCSEEMLGRVKDYITVSELRNILINMYSAKGDVYYSNSYVHEPSSPLLDSEHESTYYDKYLKMYTFSPTEVEIKGKSVSIMENGFGAKAVNLRDLMTAYNSQIKWNNGEITITNEDGESYVFYLDGFPGQIRLCSDEQICTKRSTYLEDTDNQVKVERINFFGEYEMINDSIYLYPCAYFSVLGAMGLESEMKPSELSYKTNDDIIEKLYTQARGCFWDLFY